MKSSTMRKRRNRKMKIVSKTRFAMSMTLLLVFLFSTSMIAFAALENNETPATMTEETITYTVQYGDTLWSIASTINKSHYDQEEDVRKIIYDIRKHNALSGNTIYSGQELELPVS